jgi:hypothetical protein
MNEQAGGDTHSNGVETRPGAGEGRPAGPLLRAASAVAGFAAGRARAVEGALLMAVGALLLVNAWQSGPERWREKRALRALSARGVATVERAWWWLDFDPRPLGTDGTNWQDLTAPELCVRLRMEGREGTPAGAVYCRRWQKLSSGTLLTSGAELAPGVPVAWSDGVGRPFVDLRLSKRSFRWLSERPPSFWFLRGVELSDRARRVAKSEFDVLWVIVDDPLSRVAEAWAVPRDRTIRVAYDPSHPAHVLPEGVVDEALRPEPVETLLPIMLAVGGAAFWSVGCVLLFSGIPKVVLVVGIAASVALVPWWGDRVARLLGSVWEPAGGFVDFFSREIVRRPPTPIIREPRYDGESGDVRRPWTLEGSFYAPQLAGLRLKRPPGSESVSEIRRALADSIRAQVPEPSRNIEELLSPVQ